MSGKRVNFRDSPEGGSNRSSRHTSDSGVGSLSDHSRPDHRGFTDRDIMNQWTNLPALQEAYRTIHESEQKWKKKATDLDELNSAARKQLKEAEAHRRALIDRNEELESENKTLNKEKAALLDGHDALKKKVADLRKDLERAETKLANMQQRSSPPAPAMSGANPESKPTRSASKRDPAREEKKRLSKRFDAKDHPDGPKSDSTNSSSNKPPRVRRQSYVEPFGPGPNSSRSAVPPSPTTGRAQYPAYSQAKHQPPTFSQAREPTYSGVPRTVRPQVVLDEPVFYDDPIYQEDGAYYPYPVEKPVQQSRHGR